MSTMVCVSTDHFQFYLGDRKRGPFIETSGLWEKGEKVAFVPDSPELVGVLTARYGGKTRIHVDVGGTADEASKGWSELGEFTIFVPSGEIIFWGPEMSEIKSCPSIKLPPGRYRGKAYSRGTDEISDEMDEEGPDEYRIELKPMIQEISDLQQPSAER
jgi:hypothetical protein